MRDFATMLFGVARSCSTQHCSVRGIGDLPAMGPLVLIALGFAVAVLDS